MHAPEHLHRRGAGGGATGTGEETWKPRPSAVGGAFRLLGDSTLTSGRDGGGANEVHGAGFVRAPSMPHAHAQVGPGRADNNMISCDGLGAGVKWPYLACVHRGSEPASLGGQRGGVYGVKLEGYAEGTACGHALGRSEDTISC